jgi:archaellum component FlaC
MPPPPLVKEFTFSEEQKTIERRMTFGKVAESPPPTEINKKEQQNSVERVNEIREKIRKIGIIIESYQRDVKMERLSLVDIENW